MSSASSKINEEFVQRFIEVCGSSQPVEISRLLGISYTAAKNYLGGRLPEASILLTISRQTPYSIHWLLTGEGEKLIDQTARQDIDLLVDNLSETVDPELLIDLGRFLQTYNLRKRHTSTDSPKTVILTSDKIREEKAEEKESSDLPINPS